MWRHSRLVSYRTLAAPQRRAPKALEVIKEAEATVERFGVRTSRAELHRLRGVFLTAMGADEIEIEASFCEAIRIARAQKSISLGKTGGRNLRRISEAKGERIRRTRIPITSLVTRVTPQNSAPKIMQNNFPNHTAGVRLA